MKNTLIKPREFKLTTAEILYHMPDYPSLIQSYIWQELDATPDFPELMRFLAFWSKNLEGPIHKVTITHVDPVEEPRLHYTTRSFEIH
ncbi:MAG: usg protein [Proteobacteria bacterium]|nr:usg protein [Pseudomonadota bacterium]